MKVALSIKNRIMTFGLLPETGNIQTVKMVRELREELAFTEEENEKYNLNISPQDGSYKWNKEADEEKNVDFPGVMVEVIKGVLKDMDEKKSLTDNHIDLYDIFVDAGEDTEV